MSRESGGRRRPADGTPRPQPDPIQRRQVEAMAAYGIPEPDISRRSASTRRRCENTTATNWTSARPRPTPRWRISCSTRRRTATSRRRSSGSKPGRAGARPRLNRSTRDRSAARIYTSFRTELIAIIGSAVDVPATQKAHDSERTKPNARGFLELVANGQYRPKE